MNENEAGEIAYKNGYAAGFEAGKKYADREGHWVFDSKNGITYCSKCLVLGSPRWKRCPVCEARMRGAEDG